ncbi:glycosyltransferase [Mycobacterium shigaense]|uniref:Putative glycosyl transferase n=2 Tax=Mycobacterium shigaense TaxID=722731 RepID=A0A1Z4EHV9_9MYCO|nr:glycosyltransferase [Mycobacterium shigaense]PRI12826.1 glycosyl transferase [Mycobacterium shigaense]BAX92554.1 putative glycosyl transferase [Mycobacterium shigaense]
MHVALFTDLHPATFGGAQISMITQRRALEQLGHRVTVFTPPLTTAPEPDPRVVALKPVPVIDRLARLLGRYDDYVFVWPSKTNRALIDQAFLAGEPIDIVHTQGDLGVAIAGMEAARRHGIPVVQTKHTRYDAYFEQAATAPLLLAKVVSKMQKPRLAKEFSFTSAEESTIARLAWRFMVAHAQAVDHTILPTNHFAQSLAERGVNRPMSVISNGIDDDVIDRAITAEVVRSRDGEPLRLIWCGRLSSEKRILAAIDAVSRVPNCTLDICGEGVLAASVKTAIVSAGACERIRLRGRLDHEECLRAMRASDALLFTSYGFDTQGLVLLEAAAMSLPTIYCDPALGETVPEGGGILTADPSPAALAAAIETVAENREKLRRMTDIVTAHRDIPRQSRQTEKIVTIYASLLDRVPA